MPFSSNVVLKKYFNISLSRLLWVIHYETNIISQDPEIIPADFRGCGSVTVGPELRVAEWQCEHQLQFCYQEDVDVEHSASRSGGHVIPNQLKLGWPKYCKMCGWPKTFWVWHWVLCYYHHLLLSPSLNNFYVLPCTDSLPLSTLRAPRSICSHCQKASMWGISPFPWKPVSPWPVGRREGALSKLLSGYKRNPSGAWVVHKTSVGPVLRTTFYLTHNWWHRKAKQHSSCQLTQPSWATGNILSMDSNMPVNCGCFPFCQVSQLLWAFRPTHWCQEALIKSTPLEIKR